MELVIVPKNSSSIKKYYNKFSNTFILGLKDFTVNYKKKFSINEIKKYLKKFPAINLFISIDKMISNPELNKLEKTLLELNKLNIKGILFYDNSLLSFKEKLNLTIPLVWNNSFGVTNYNTCNYYYNKGCQFAVISSEITLEEMIEIKNKTSLTLMINIFGYLPIAHSKRNLITNYFKNIHKFKFKKEYLLTEKSSKIEILAKEDKNGTTFLRHELINATEIIKPLIENDFFYFILIEDYVSKNKILEILTKYYNIINKKVDLSEELKNLDKSINSNFYGFFKKKTIFKVKK